MGYKIVSDKCQSLCNWCVDICPVACIKVDSEADIGGKDRHRIDSIDCIECGICTLLIFDISTIQTTFIAKAHTSRHISRSKQDLHESI